MGRCASQHEETKHSEGEQPHLGKALGARHAVENGFEEPS